MLSSLWYSHFLQSAWCVSYFDTETLECRWNTQLFTVILSYTVLYRVQTNCLQQTLHPCMSNTNAFVLLRACIRRKVTKKCLIRKSCLSINVILNNVYPQEEPIMKCLLIDNQPTVMREREGGVIKRLYFGMWSSYLVQEE